MNALHQSLSIPEGPNPKKRRRRSVAPSRYVDSPPQMKSPPPCAEIAATLLASAPTNKNSSSPRRCNPRRALPSNKNYSSIEASDLALISRSNTSVIPYDASTQVQELLQPTNNNVVDQVVGSSTTEQSLHHVKKQQRRKFAIVVEPPSESVMAIANRINEEARKIFDTTSESNDNNSSVVASNATTNTLMSRPCLSARMFACYVLFGTPSNAATTSEESSIFDRLSFIEPTLLFLKAMVCVELSFLDHLEMEGNATPLGAKPRTVHFSLFDGSSVSPPVDRQLGSEEHQQRSISAMVQAIEEIRSLSQSALPCIKDVCAFLESNFVDATKTQTVMLACAAAASCDFPPNRVRTLAKLYINDFHVLEQRILNSDPTLLENHVDGEIEGAPAHSSEAVLANPLRVEKCLAEILGPAIRFQLRLLLNPAPPRLCPQDVAYETRSSSYSKVSSLITLTMPKDATQDNPAAADDCISAIVSNALCSLIEYFGMERMIDADYSLLPDIPESFCTSSSSNCHLSLRDVRMLTSDDIEIAIRDINEAMAFLAAAKAIQFLVDLLTAPGVFEEIQRMNGWSHIESYALLSQKYGLWKLCPADSHLFVLVNCRVLLERLRACHDVVGTRMNSCEEALHHVRRNYHISSVGSPKSRAKRKPSTVKAENPQLTKLTCAWKEGMSRAQSFPLVKAAAVP